MNRSQAAAFAQAAAPRILALCARQPNRFASPKAISEIELLEFRTLVAFSLHSLGGQSSRLPERNTAVLRPHGLEQTILGLNAQMDTYENPEHLELALSHIPLDTLHSRAEEIQKGPSPLPCFEDALAEAVVKWFKPTFFTWIDPITCTICQGHMQMSEMVSPNAEERAGRTGRVELHRCKTPGCSGSFRFPRYNDLPKLLQTRIGRCGEFANTFTLILRAVGLRARYVWNKEDHVWNEYYSPGLCRWVHMDSCENARDQHLIYSRGWGKKMSYVIAFSVDGAQDVTRAYVQDWDDAASRRHDGSEEALEKVLSEVTRRRRFGLGADDLARLKTEDALMRTWLDDSEARHKREQEAEIAREAGRQSGTDEWKESRGETGDRCD